MTESIRQRGRQLLELARTLSEQKRSWAEIHNAIYGVGGKAAELLPTQAERTAFARTAEARQILELLEGAYTGGCQGKLSLRLPRSLHAALLAEAEAEGVSLNQLCVAKLAARLQIGL